MKRFADIVIASVALFCLSPLMILVGIGIRAQDGGPILFRQRRVGLHGRPFTMWKFRSMVIDAENRGGFSTAERDPRITFVGRIIRRTSLDELPQLINVLMGDMSIVGPRPDVPAQREGYTENEWQIRTSVKPGITGLAQATVRSKATVEERKRLDLEYAASQSLVLDTKIILLTVKQVLSRGGN